MKFKADANLMAVACNAGRSYTVRSGQCMFGMLYLNAENNVLNIRATDGKSEYSTNLDVEVEEAGCVAVPAEKLAAVVAKTTGTLEFSHVDNGDKADKFNVKAIGGTSKMKATLRALKGSDYPEFVPCEEDEWHTINAGLFANALKNMAPIPENDDNAKPVRRALHVEQNDDMLTFVATNGKSLGTQSFILEDKDAKLTSINIPSAFIGKILPLLKEETAEIAYGAATARLYVRSGQTTISSSLFDPTYCAWRRVIPQNPTFHVELDCDEFADAIDLVSITCDMKSHRIHLAISNGKITVLSENESNDKMCQEVEAVYEGDDMNILLSKDLIVPCLKALEGRILFEFTTATQAVIIRNADGNGPLFVVMPMQNQ